MKRIVLGLGAILVAATVGCGDDDNPAGPGGPGDGGTGNAGGGTGNGGSGNGGSGNGGSGGEGGDTFHDPATGAWEDGFNLPGLSGFASRAEAVIEGPDGKVYAGGIFLDAAGVPASNVAAWNGTNWEALGAGLPGWVKALAFGSDGTLYAGGSFATETTANRLARWDGTSWTMIDGDVLGDIDSLAVQGDRLLVGGTFSDVDGLGTAGIAAYDDSGWSAIGTTGADGGTSTILVTGPDSFCMGGSFGTVDGVLANCAACWDGVAWSEMGDGLPGMVSRLATAPDGTIFGAGNFAFITDPNTGEYEAGIARLVGDTWEPFEGGVDMGFINEVRGVAFASDGDLLIGGTFETVDKIAVAAQNLARFDFQTGTWTELAGGVRNDVGVALGSVVGPNDILVREDGSIWVGGLFSSADHGETQAANIARLTDGDWSTLVGAGTTIAGIAGLLNAMDLDEEGRVVAGGYFPSAGGVAAANIARLGPSGWEPLGAGLNSIVRAVVVTQDGSVVAGGEFVGSGNTLAPFIARWNGTAWSALGAQLDGPVSTVVEAPNGDLYVGGDFEKAGDLTVNRVARWDGTAWSAVGAGFDGRVTSLAVDAADRLVATGLFQQTGTVTVKGLAIFEDGAWKGFGGGFDGGDFEYGSRVVAHGDGFYVGGAFSAIDGTPATGLAYWDGSSWSTVGELATASGFGLIITDVLPYGDGLFATGTFDQSGSTPLSYVGWWDGTAWKPLAGGMADLGECLRLDGTKLWVGGGFVEVDGKSDSGIAAWEFAD